MSSQIKFGSCGLKSDNISRRIRAWGGLFFRVEYFKIPRQVEVEICVYIKKLYLRENVLKLNIKYTSTFNNNCGGARWIDWYFFHSFMPTVPHI